MTKDSTARGTNTPFILSCYIPFFRTAATYYSYCFMSVLCTIKYIRAGIPIFVSFTSNLRRITGLIISSVFFLALIFQLWNSTAYVLFSILEGKVLSFLGLQGWNNRSRELLATHWAVWWGDSGNCTRADSLSGQVLCMPFRVNSSSTDSLPAEANVQR